MNSSNDYGITSGDMLSGDLIYEIMLRLPVKSLRRFKAVSKSWHSLISSPSFVESHLSFTRPGDDETFIVLKDRNDVSFSLVHLGSGKLVADLPSPYSQGDQLPSKPYAIIVGSARGIVCVSVLCRFRLKDPIKYTYLWNPATKESKLIPLPPPDDPGFNFMSDDKKGYYYVPCGFGFDPIDNDFKFVRAYGYYTEVYSTNKNSWRAFLSGLSFCRFMREFGVCVDRFLCWTNHNSVVAFDLNKEVFNSSAEFPNGSNYCNIAEFNNSIVAIVIDYKEFNGKFGLWKLDDVECLGGGVEASWTLLVNIDTNIHDIPAMNFVDPCFIRGNLLLSDMGALLIYNIGKKESKKVPVATSLGHIFKYKESQVSITRSKQIECSNK